MCLCGYAGTYSMCLSYLGTNTVFYVTCISHIVCDMCTQHVFCCSALCLCEFFLRMYCVWSVLACAVCLSVGHLCMCATRLGLHIEELTFHHLRHM